MELIKLGAAAIMCFAIGGIADQVFAEGMAIRAPIECEISLAEAKVSFEEMLEKVKSCQQRSQEKKGEEKKDGIPPSVADALQNLSSILQGTVEDECLILRSATDRTFGCNLSPSLYYWAPTDQLQDGKAALAQLLKRARDGKWFDQRFGTYVIVESEGSAAEEQHLALCSVTRIGDVVGPPRDCETVAIITPDRAWLRAQTRQINIGDFIQRTSYSVRLTGAIDISFDVAHRNPLELSGSLLRTLKTDLGLSVLQEVSRAEDGSLQSIYLRAATPVRDSKILQSGWREALDFDILLRPQNNRVDIRGTAHALVCRQALGDLIEYHGLDDAQRAAYAKALDGYVDAAIKAVCKNYIQRDAKTINCN